MPSKKDSKIIGVSPKEAEGPSGAPRALTTGGGEPDGVWVGTFRGDGIGSGEGGGAQKEGTFKWLNASIIASAWHCSVG